MIMKIYDEYKLYEVKSPDLGKYKLAYKRQEKSKGEVEEYLICVPYTDEEREKERIAEIKERLSQLSEDFVQAWAGAQIADIEARKREFADLHNELRGLLGKAPRVYY